MPTVMKRVCYMDYDVTDMIYINITMHFQVDVYCYKKPFFPMEWVGKHALMLFVLVACNIAPILIHGFYWREPQNNLVRSITMFC